MTLYVIAQGRGTKMDSLKKVINRLAERAAVARC